MKAYVCIAFVLSSVFVSPAAAYTTQECGDWNEFGQVVMYMRQKGVPISEAYQAASQTQKENPVSKSELELYLNVINYAYSFPVQHSYRKATNVTIEFGKEIYSMCVAGWE
ncbi:hypothetical protein [Thioclava sp. DLFJ5-1]|uniref:hypothetical protein n=1 Tax=Thioclava sp. DLFJ5-1 TaxID=1915314 RepID=UPI00117F26F5|nr:hypothetical protein [Thioclava sp. DLFJ5-1]